MGELEDAPDAPSSRRILDVKLDFRNDCPPGSDPDVRSPLLREYHRTLWSKPLPSGHSFELRTDTPTVYLHHKSDLGEFSLSSDSVIPSFRKERRLEPVFTQLRHGELEAFVRLSYTIGGMMVFPGNQVQRQMTINGARGCHPRIKDRFDLTVECIRRHYLGGKSPLTAVLARYSDFFTLFTSFQGYIDFFLLQDLVTPDYSTVKVFSPCADFDGSPIPDSLALYRAYCTRAGQFIEARSQRMAKWLAQRANDR